MLPPYATARTHPCAAGTRDCSDTRSTCACACVLTTTKYFSGKIVIVPAIASFKRGGGGEKIKSTVGLIGRT